MQHLLKTFHIHSIDQWSTFIFKKMTYNAIWTLAEDMHTRNVVTMRHHNSRTHVKIRNSFRSFLQVIWWVFGRHHATLTIFDLMVRDRADRSCGENHHFVTPSRHKTLKKPLFEFFSLTMATRLCFLYSIVRPLPNVHFDKDDPRCYLQSVMRNIIMKSSFNVWDQLGPSLKKINFFQRSPRGSPMSCSVSPQLTDIFWPYCRRPCGPLLARNSHVCKNELIRKNSFLTIRHFLAPPLPQAYLAIVPWVDPSPLIFFIYMTSAATGAAWWVIERNVHNKKFNPSSSCHTPQKNRLFY